MVADALACVNSRGGGRRAQQRAHLALALAMPQIADVVLHLATNTFTTGQELVCAGGADLGYGKKNQRWAPGGSGTAQ